MTTLLMKKLQGNKRSFDILKETTTLILKKLQGSYRSPDFSIGIEDDDTTT